MADFEIAQTSVYASLHTLVRSTLYTEGQPKRTGEGPARQRASALIKVSSELVSQMSQLNSRFRKNNASKRAARRRTWFCTEVKNTSRLGLEADERQSS